MSALDIILREQRGRKPTFERDFAGVKTLDHGTGPAITFTRGSNATYFDASGTLRFAPNNHIRNSEATGATVGVLGSGGASPMNWALTPNANGVTTEIIGTGTEGGLTFIDIKVSGTPTASSGVQINFDSNTQVVAANGQTWTTSAYVKLAGGATTNATIDTVVVGRTSAGAGVSGQQVVTTYTPTSSALNTQRRTATVTFTDATVERVQGRVTVAFTSGNPIDLTLRIAAPQLELGSTATDYNPTTGTSYFGPRFDHDPATAGNPSRGLLIEEARTNSIRNSQAGGAVAGSAGTGPSNWNVSGNANGLTRTISLGSVNGFSYIDVRFAGTATATVQNFFDPEGLTAITASSGQVWTHSAYVALIAGTVPDLQIGVREGLADGTFVASGNLNASPSLTASLQRFSHTRTLTDATTARVTPTIRVSISNGVAYDFTLRIAAPQLEQGAFPTSYIPTTTAAATRAADSAVVTPISSFWNDAEGTVYAENVIDRYGGSFPAVLHFNNGTNSTNHWLHFYGASANQLSLGSDDFNFTTGTVTVGQIQKYAAAVATNNGRGYRNGTASTEDTSITMVFNKVRLDIGGQVGGGNKLNGHIRKIAYWPRRLSNTLLQQLTT